MNRSSLNNSWFSQKNQFQTALRRNEIHIIENRPWGSSVFEVLSEVLFHDRALKKLVELLLINFTGIPLSLNMGVRKIEKSHHNIIDFLQPFFVQLSNLQIYLLKIVNSKIVKLFQSNLIFKLPV